MKTIRVNQFGGPEVLRLEESADPTPGPGQVLVRVHAAGRPVVGREFPLGEASRAHEAVLQSGALGKIVLIP